ncbi:TPA: site-specific DNA-methyltransferase [Legionella pneumophila]|nr:site-specific DNA-methyltransferase [Legionella pneumophila]
MDSLKMHSKDITENNIEKIAELFPNCIIEAKDRQGQSIKSIDFDLLRQELSREIVEGPQERYQLNWPGKRQSLLAANAAITKTLRPCREESVDYDKTQNLFIEGDNLDALKLLQETYLGKVKMIYIDPPYNTGNDFIYLDNFYESSDEYFKKSNQDDGNGNQLVANPETYGRFHSNWLSMMYSRLKLARNLLKNDGVIFISIDDGEHANIKKICDEIFGEENFQSNIAWQKRYTRSNNTLDFTTVIEYILVYSKTSDFVVNLLPRSEEADARYTNPDNDERGPWKGASFLNPASPSKRPNLCYPIRNPNTGQITNPTTNAWRRSKNEFDRLGEENRLYWGKDGKQQIPSVKMFLSEARGLTPINFWEHNYAGNTDSGTYELQETLGIKVFDNPKPSKLIYRCLEHGTGKNDIILDFFAGTSTTANAVMQLNSKDGGKRKYIMIQLPELCDKKSEAYKAGYHTIADISKERIRRAGQKIKEENAGKGANDTLDTGFRVLKVDSSNMTNVYYTANTINQDLLTQHTDNVKPDRTAEDLLFQVLLDWGVDLTLPITQKNILDHEVFFVDEDALVACFDNDGRISEELVKELTQYTPLRVVFRDAGFASDSVKINVTQIFKQLSPHTEVKTI